MADETTPNPSPADQASKPPAAKAGAKPSAAKATGEKPKKEKPPKIEDKPFQEFIEQHYLPSLEQALKQEGIESLSLSFEKTPLAVVGAPAADPYWQVVGKWQENQRQFNVAFLSEDISGQKVFSCAANGAKASTIEQFMGDERRVTLDLLVLYTVQRLNGQKWLTGN
jgi:hypothetical protein